MNKRKYTQKTQNKSQKEITKPKNSDPGEKKQTKTNKQSILNQS